MKKSTWQVTIPPAVTTFLVKKSQAQSVSLCRLRNSFQVDSPRARLKASTASDFDKFLATEVSDDCVLCSAGGVIGSMGSVSCTGMFAGTAEAVNALNSPGRSRTPRLEAFARPIQVTS